MKTSKNSLSYFWYIGMFLLVVAISSISFAEEAAVEEEFPQKGLLAAQGSLPSSNFALPLPPGMAPGKTPLITGGISRDGAKTWKYSVTNNFEQPIRLSVSIREYDSTLKNIGSSSDSFRLKPGETQSGKFEGRANGTGCALVMDSWKFQ